LPCFRIFPYTTLFRSANLRRLRIHGGIPDRASLAGRACAADLRRRERDHARNRRPRITGERQALSCDERRNLMDFALTQEQEDRSEEHTSELQSRENL